MITIPTTELIGCLSAVLPITLDPKDNALAGVAIEWDGEALHFTVYDVVTGATVRWVPGEGAEGEIDEDTEEHTLFDWGASDGDSPWRVFIGHADAKEIVKLFKLPAKLWRYPVTLKVNLSQTKLIIERQDGPRGERLLTVSTDNAVLRNIPDVRVVAGQISDGAHALLTGAQFNGLRLASLGPSTAYGVLTFNFGVKGNPVAATAGSRYAAFIYESGTNPRPYNVLRDSAGLVTTS